MKNETDTPVNRVSTFLEGLRELLTSEPGFREEVLRVLKEEPEGLNGSHSASPNGVHEHDRQAGHDARL